MRSRALQAIPIGDDVSRQPSRNGLTLSGTSNVTPESGIWFSRSGEIPLSRRVTVIAMQCWSVTAIHSSALALDVLPQRRGHAMTVRAGLDKSKVRETFGSVLKLMPLEYARHSTPRVHFEALRGF